MSTRPLDYSKSVEPIEHVEPVKPMSRHFVPDVNRYQRIFWNLKMFFSVSATKKSDLCQFPLTIFLIFGEAS